MKRLGTIDETRWWSKDSALRKVFGSYNNPSGALFMDIINSLTAILSSNKIKAVAKAKVKGFIESLLKFETILTAQVYLRIFSFTTPLSKYLQTVQLDLLTAQRMVDKLLKNMHTLRDSFHDCYDAASKFVQWANDLLNEMESLFQ